MAGANDLLPSHRINGFGYDRLSRGPEIRSLASQPHVVFDRELRHSANGYPVAVAFVSPAHDRVLVFQECELGELRGGGVHRRSGIGRLAGIPGRLENQPGLSRRKRHNSIVARRGWVAVL